MATPAPLVPPSPDPNATPLDTAIATARYAETTYAADLKNLLAIQSQIAALQGQIAAIQAQMAADGAAFNTSLDALSSAAAAAKIQASDLNPPPTSTPNATSGAAPSAPASGGASAATATTAPVPGFMSRIIANLPSIGALGKQIG